MPSWSRGRVALVGDAAACPSLLAGQGSALAMVEAYVLAAELARSQRRPRRGVRPLPRAARRRCCVPSRTRRRGWVWRSRPETRLQLARPEHGDEADGTAEGRGSGRWAGASATPSSCRRSGRLSRPPITWSDPDSPSSPPAQQQAILRAALDEFAAHGFHDASLNRVIDAAGISKGSMYYYFDGKEDLYAHVTRVELERLFACVGPFADSDRARSGRLLVDVGGLLPST